MVWSSSSQVKVFGYRYSLLSSCLVSVMARGRNIRAWWLFSKGGLQAPFLRPRAIFNGKANVDTVCGHLIKQSQVRGSHREHVFCTSDGVDVFCCTESLPYLLYCPPLYRPKTIPVDCTAILVFIACRLLWSYSLLPVITAGRILRWF